MYARVSGVTCDVRECAAECVRDDAAFVTACDDDLMNMFCMRIILSFIERWPPCFNSFINTRLQYRAPRM